MSLDEWKSLGATRQVIEDGGDDGGRHSPQSRVKDRCCICSAWEGEMATEPDVQQVVEELAETGADPSWVAEALPLNRRRLQQRAQRRLRVSPATTAPATPR